MKQLSKVLLTAGISAQCIVLNETPVIKSTSLMFVQFNGHSSFQFFFVKLGIQWNSNISRWVTYLTVRSFQLRVCCFTGAPFYLKFVPIQLFPALDHLFPINVNIIREYGWELKITDWGQLKRSSEGVKNCFLGKQI